MQLSVVLRLSEMAAGRARKMPRFDEDQLTVTQQFRLFKKSHEAEVSERSRCETPQVLVESGELDAREQVPDPVLKSASDCGEGWYMGGFVPPEGMFAR